MVFKLDIEPELLESMYWGNDYSDWQIAGIFGCSEGAINRRRKECGIISHINRELTDFKFNDRQKEIFEGCMLGDGGLIWRGENCYFHNGDSHKEYLIWLQEQLGISDISSITPVYYFAGARSPCGYLLRTRVVPSLYNDYSIWYPNGAGTRGNLHHKIIPKAIELTTTKALFWYIGDGTYRKDNKAIFFTNTFNPDGAGMCIDKLNVLLDVNNGIAMHNHHRNDDNSISYRIYLNKEVSKKFFDLVDELDFDVPDCYQYKFGR